MNNSEITAVVAKLKERAVSSPWQPLRVPVGAPPQEHFHFFPNGLSLCFTLDVLPPGAKYWHLSIVRTLGSPTTEEIELWRRAFFDEPPIMAYPAQLLSKGWHFFWEVRGGV